MAGGSGTTCSSPVTVTGAEPEASPDLPVPFVSAGTSPFGPPSGGPIQCGATVENQGDGPSQSTTLSYHRSTDVTIWTSDTEVGVPDRHTPVDVLRRGPNKVQAPRFPNRSEPLPLHCTGEPLTRPVPPDGCPLHQENIDVFRRVGDHLLEAASPAPVPPEVARVEHPPAVGPGRDALFSCGVPSAAARRP